MALKKPGPMATAAAGCDVVPAAGGMGRFELIWEFLVSVRYGDGAPRQLPTLMFFVHDGRFTAALNDRDNGRTAFVSGDTLESVLEALERGLSEDTLGWRPNKPPGGKQRR